MAKKQRIALILSVLAIGIVAGVLISRAIRSDKTTERTNSLKTLKSSVVDLVTQRDPSLVQVSVSRQDQARGRLWTLEQPEESRQEFLVDANYEQGESLKKLTGYTKQSLRESVVANINIQLPKQYPQYKEITQRNLTVNGFDANETVFEYVNSGVRVKQRLLLLIKNSQTAVYIRAQTKADQYKGINDRYLEPIFSGAKFE